MDTLKFFNRVLASTGRRCVCAKTAKGMFQAFGRSNLWAAEAAGRLDTNSKDTYIAVATFGDEENRKARNAVAARSHFLDIDCGPGKAYAAKREGVEALVRFCSATCTPSPLIVDSGGGLHAWFVHDEDMEPVEWKRTADKLKEACRRYGLAQDPACTADIARLLRIPGTHNRKGGGKREVKVIHAGHVTAPKAFEQALDAALAASGGFDGAEGPELPPGRPARSLAAKANADLAGGIEASRSRPSSAERIADRCAVMDMVRETRGNVDEPTWRAALTILRRTKEAPEICHEWSDGHPQYSRAETDKKLAYMLDGPDGQPVGPALCGTLAANHEHMCLGCPYAELERFSPITLGEDQPVVVTAKVKDAAGAEVAPSLIHGYKWGKKEDAPRPQLLAVDTTPDEDGKLVHTEVAISNTLFFPVERLRVGPDEYALEILTYERDAPKNRFLLPCKTIGRGGSELIGELAQREVTALPGMKMKIETYLNRWVDHLKETVDEVQVQEHLGWIGRNFLIGDTLVTPQGLRRAPVQGYAKLLAPHYEPAGSYDEWKRIVNQGYNYPGQEAYQYMVLLSFAAPLLSMIQGVNGVTVHAFSQGSGIGKTTAQRAGLAAWGNFEAIQMSAKLVTENALWQRVGAVSNLPVMVDEMTNEESQKVADLVFLMGAGQPKQRLNSDSTPKKTPPPWRTILMTSANNTISEKLTSHRADAEAEMARLFEVRMTNTSRISPNEALDLFNRLANHYGHAGREYMSYVVEHYEDVANRLGRVQRSLNERVGVSQKERYWSALQATVLTALFYCRKLDILQFDMGAMQQWIMSQVEVNRAQLNTTVGDPIELFGRMLSSFHSNILVTHTMGDMRRLPARLVSDDARLAYGDIVGRAIITPDEFDKNNNHITTPRLYLSVNAVRGWTAKNGVSAQEIFDRLVRQGAASPAIVSMSLGKGTLRYAGVTPSVKCWEIYLDKVTDVSAQKLSVAQ